jgi:glycosyltransferase involved in cell wall biosynthesis
MNYGGLQKVVELLALNQLQAGHSVTIGCWTNVSNHPEAEAELERAGADIVYLRRAPDGSLAFERGSLFQRLKSHLGARNADILHVHNPFRYYIYGALAARATRGTRIVNTTHLTMMFDLPQFGPRGRAKFWTAAMLTDALVAVCSEDENYLRNRFRLPGKQLLTIENGINLAPFLAVPPRRPSGEVVLGFAGRMEVEKNHRVLIEAFALLRKTRSNVRLRLVGGGSLEPQLQEQARNLGLNDVIEFGGFCNDVPGFLAGLDVYVLPSDFEAHPLSLLEAIASGLPVVATVSGGVAKIVQSTDSGWVCPIRNAGALCAAMETAIASPDRFERPKRARKLAEELYSAERMSRDYEQLYRTLLQ